MTIKHLPTQKTYQIDFEKKNKVGLWYFSKCGVWIWAEDCLIIQ